MRTKRNWLRTTIAMLTLVATVLETGFSSVQTFAAEITTEDGIVVNTDAVEETGENLDITVEPDDGGQTDFEVVEASADEEFVETVEETPEVEEYSEEVPEEAEVFEEAEELLEGTLDVSDSGITGSGYDEISVYVNTDELDNRDKFRIEFTGPASASYNPVLNEDLDKTNDGRYDFDSLEGGEFTIRANSSDDVILSYSYNEDGYPLIVVESIPAEKVLTTKTLTSTNGDEIEAISGEGFDSITVKFNTEELSDKASFKFFVESDAAATVNGKDASEGISGLGKDSDQLTVEDLDEESFVAYVVSDDEEIKIKSIVNIDSVEDAVAIITVDNEDTKRVYEYEDNKVKVTATLEKADAVPDDAYFGVTPLTEEESEKYLEALNKDKDVENGDILATADNTLLYDIGFYTDDTKAEEIEPEEGSVRVSIEFKRDQLAEDLGAVDDDEVTVTHIVEEGSTITTETVDVDASVEDGVVEFETDSFSLWAIQTDGTLKFQTGTERDFKKALGANVNYGIVSNSINLRGHNETNFATKVLNGDVAMNSCKNDGGGTGFTYIGAYEGNYFKLTDNGNKGKVLIYTTPEAAAKFNSDQEASGTLVDTVSYSQDEINTLVDELIGEAQRNADAMFDEKYSYDFGKFKDRINTNPGDKMYYLDLTQWGSGDGTYYFNFDNGEFGDWSGSTNGLKIKMTSKQTVVFNIPDKNVILNQNVGLIIDNIDYSPNGTQPMISEHLIYNMPKAETVTFQGNVDGAFICPKAEIEVNNTSGGWLVAKDVAKVGGAEWHCTWHDMPETKTEEKGFDFRISKAFDGPWPEEGFTFKIEPFTGYDDEGNKQDDNPVMPEKNLITIYENSPDHSASFGKITMDAQKVYDRGSDASWYWHQDVHCLSFMYKITEVIPNPKRPGITYQTEPWYVKLWINAYHYKYGNLDVYKLSIEPKTKMTKHKKCLPIKDRPIEFVNTYKPLGARVQFEGIKKINDDNTAVPANTTFEFSLYEYLGDGKFATNPIQTKSNVGSSITFDPIDVNFKNNKENSRWWLYLIKETKCDDPPYKKDEGVYVARVTLEKRDGEAVPNVQYYRFEKGQAFDFTTLTGGGDSFKFAGSKFVFTNRYSATGEAEFWGKKTLKGRKINKNDKFTFKLSSTDDTQEKANQTKEFSGPEVAATFFKFKFDKLSYSEKDIGKTYHYVIEETAVNSQNITVSSVKHNVSVTITDTNMDGELEVDQHDFATCQKPATFENIYSAAGNIVFRAEKGYAENTALSTDQSFSFILKELEGNTVKSSMTKSVTGPGTVTFLEEGKTSTYDYKLTDLPKNDDGTYGSRTYNYTINEVVPDGAVDIEGMPGKKLHEGIVYDARTYRIKVVVSDNGDGTLKKEIYGAYDKAPVDSDKIEAVDPSFINDYRVIEKPDHVEGTKVLHGKDLEVGEFTFKLDTADTDTATAVNSGLVVMPSSLTVQNGIPEAELEKNQFRFGDITFKAAGTYKFKVTEDRTNPEPNMVYATDEFIATFTVSDNKNGTLSIAREFSKVGSNGTVDGISFVNTSYRPGEIPLYAYKDLTGRTLTAGQFSFLLKQGNNTLQTKSNDETGLVTFDELEFTYDQVKDEPSQTKEFVYTIEEVIPEGAKTEDDGKTYKLNGYTYDGHKETVTVTVTASTDENGNGIVTVTSDNAQRDGNKAVFRNYYSAKGDTELEGIKKITGRKFTNADNGKFYAELYYTDGPDDYKIGDRTITKGALIEKVPITKSTEIFGENGGEFKFAKLEYTKTGVYEYTVKESETDTVNNVTNDTTVYTVKVTVTDTNGTGKLSVVPNKTKNDICFDNTYHAENTTHFEAKKRVNGELSSNKKFTFILKDAAGNEVDSKTNGDGGKIKFQDLKFTQADLDETKDETEKVYTISEKIETLSGYTLSTEVYTAKAILKLNDTGGIDVSNKYYNSKGEEVDEAEVFFDNTYAAEGTVDLYARKKLTGKNLEAGQFKFELYDESGTKIGDATNLAADNGAYANAAFPQIKYTQADLDADASHQIEDGKFAKYYTMKEWHPADATTNDNGRTYKKDGYTYDGRTYNVIVTLKDKGNGKIETDWYAFERNSTHEDPSFWQGVWNNVVEFVTGTNAEKNAAFDNEYAAEGALDLSAKKVLRGKELKAGDFEFTLSGRDEAGNEFVDPKNNNEDGSVVFDRIRYTKPGEYTYTIKESVPIGATKENGIFVLNGVKYDATEYTVNVVVSDPGTGKLKVDATVNGGGATTSAEVTEGDKTISLCAPAAVTFNNNYDAKPVTINPGGTKTLTGRKLENGEFSFNMKSAAGNPKAYDETVQNVGGTFTFPAIEYTFADMALANGKYADEKPFEYVVTEVIPEDKDKLEGVEYDTSEYKVVVTVKNSNGTLSAKITSNAVDAAADKIASFTNNYNTNDSTTFNVKKIVNGTSATDKKFKFTLTGDGIETPLEATAANGETASFAPISYTLTDIKNTDGTYSKTYNYTVSEVNTNEKGYTYSTEVYDAVVTVTSDGVSGKLDIDKELTKDGKPYTEPVMVFTNTYEAKGKVVIDGTKDLVGRDLKDGEFKFILSRKGDDGQYENIGNTTNDPAGKFSFEQNYTQDDIGKTYYYKVNELVPDKSEETGIDYDRSVYDITVTVADNGDGTLNVSKEIKKGDGTAEVCAFTNKDVKPDTVVFEAKKTLTGKALGNDMFTFTLTGDGQNQTVKNKGVDVTFDPIQYSLKDAGKTFNYTIREVVGDTKVDGIKYDESVYNAQVKVTLVDGKLVIDKTVTKDGKVVTDIGFTNSYESKTSVEFGGSKILSGFVDGATPLGTYSFELKDADGNVLQTKEVTPKKAGDSTEIKFDPIEYDQDDYLDSAATDHKFTYTVKEVIPTVKAANVTYDEKEYNITVELAYDLNGLLTATKSTSQGVDPATGLVFTNKYEAEGDITLDGIKTITGKDLEDGAYTFTLTGEDQNQTKVNVGNSFTFDPIHYEAKDIGEHVYTIAESATTKDGSKYDATKYTVKVTVAEGNDGKLEVTKRVFKTDAEGKETEIGATDAITFNNTFTAKGSITIDGIKIMKNKPLKAGDFTFILKDENGVELQRTSHDAAPLNNKQDRIATAAFKFDAIEYSEEDLKAADGSYLKETTKYYTVEEEAGSKGGVTYSRDVYVIEVTIKSNGTENLVVTKKVRNKNEIKEEDGGIRGFFKNLLGRDDEENTQIKFENEYNSQCDIDPPLLSKEIMGRNIERGLFTFKITGPAIPSMEEDWKDGKGAYERTVKNGFYVSGGEIPGKPGEISVDDILYKFMDLDVDLETGDATGKFIYYAEEVDDGKAGVIYSPAKFHLEVNVRDDNEGHLIVTPGKDNDGNQLDKLTWVQDTANLLTREDLEDKFLNIFNQEGSIDLVGVKKLDGRKLTKDDKFEFVLTDDATGKTAKVNNTNDSFGVPSVVAFNASEIDFLNYKWGAFEDENKELKEYDDRGDHTYTVEETYFDQNGIVSDTSKFKITVSVTEAFDADGNPLLDATGKHGKLNVAVTKVEKIISENNKESFDHADGNFFEFKNEFKATGKTELDGIKYLKDQAGNALASPDSMLDQYEFALYSYEDAARTIGKTLVSVAKTSANGSFKLDIPEYTQEVLKDEKGEYADEKTLYYRLVEVKPSSGVWTENNTIFESDGVVYDNTEYDVDVNVKFNGTQKLDVSKTIRKADTGEAITSISYTNIVKEYTTVEGNKYWVDNIKDPSQRPDVTVNLYRRTASGVETKINSYTIVAPDTTYRFATDDKGNKLPTYDSAGRPISYVVEELPITGYLSEKVNYDFYNTAGDILIRKIDADTRAPLSGAVLAIFDGSTEIERWTSGTSAHVIESALTAGKTYTLREITAPEGYGVAEDMTFTVPADGSSITVTMSDPPIIGSVRLTKRDASTRETLAGAEFALYNDAGTRIYATGTPGSYSATTSTSNGVFVTDSAGTLTIADLPYGTYYFVETKAPEGYTLSTERLGFTILRSGELVEVTYLNTKATGAVRLRKVGSDGTRSLAGAVFELYAATPRSIGQAASSTIFSDAYFRYGTYRTNSAGELYVGDLPWDDYYFIEVEAPSGYETATDVNGDDLVYTFTVNAANADVTIDLGGIVNTPERPPITPPPGPTPTPTTPPAGVLGARVKRGGVVNGVLGVRAKPSSGVLGVRVGPVTGDASNIILWLLLLTACVATIVATIVTGRKKKTATK